MRRHILTALALCLGVGTVAAGSAAAQEKKAQQGHLTGMVQGINKQTSTITVRTGNMKRDIIYNSETKFLYGTEKKNKPSSLDELKDGWYLNCKGTFEGVKLVATGCRFREEQRTTQQ